MASSENTAINELIARVSGGPTLASARMAATAPIEAAGGAEPRVSSSLPAQPSLPAGAPLMRPPSHVPSPPYPPDMQLHGMPATMPVVAPFEAQQLNSPSAYPMVPRGMAATQDVAYGDPAAAQQWRSSMAGSEWVEPTQLVHPRHRERFVGTLKLRHSDLRVTAGKLALTMVLLMGAGIFIGSYVVFSGETVTPSNRAVAAAAAALPPASPEPVQATEVAPPAPVAALEAAPAANPAALAQPADPSPARSAPEPVATANVEPVPVAMVEPSPAIGSEPAPPGKPAPAPAASVESAPTAKPASVPAANIEPAPVAQPAPVAMAKPEPALAAKAELTPAEPPSPSSSAHPPAAPGEANARVPVLVDVRIDSTPNGATVTLVDRGKSQFVGKTPVNATFDTSREYDLVFTFPSKATQQKHLNASTTRRVAVTLGEQANAQPAPVSAPASTPASPPRHIEKAVVEKPAVEKPPIAPVRRPGVEPGPGSSNRKPGKAAGEPVLGEGTLMVSSKPPCQIVIDGKPTGLTTPQRAITLAAGNHKITLINGEKDIKKTVSVQITANGTEKVIEDLMP